MRNRFCVKWLLFTVSTFIASAATAVPFKVTMSPVTLQQGIVNNIAFKITNQQSVPVAISGLNITGPSGFTFLSSSDGNCKTTLAPGETCTTDPTLYSPIQLNETWKIAVQTHYGAVIYKVAKKIIPNNQLTTVIINPDNNNNAQDIIIDSSQPITHGTFMVKNIGIKSWVNANVTRDAADSSWLTLTSSTCIGTIAPGATCSVSYKAERPFGNAASVITATGDTIGITRQDAELNNKLSIGTEADANFIHLGYRAIKVTNLTAIQQSLNNVSTTISSSLVGKIILCDTTGNDCPAQYTSGCLISGRTLPKGGDCHLWFKAMENDSPVAGIAGEITASANTSGGKTLSRHFAVMYGDKLYLASQGTAKGTPVNLVNTLAAWDGNAWVGVGGAMNQSVFALTTLNGDLYAAGNFTTAGGAVANYVARWNGLTWSPLGRGLDSYASALTTLNGRLYTTGDFIIAGDSFVSHIASWNGTSWAPLGSGLNAPASSLATLHGRLYAAGSFTTAGGSATNYIASWNGSNWASLASGLNAPASSLATLHGKLYTSGNFTTAGDSVVNYIARWNGTSWAPLGSGLNGVAPALSTLNGTLYAAGNFTTAGGSAANHIAGWSGSNWSPLGSGVSASINYSPITSMGNNIYVGGYFTHKIYSWNGSQWQELPNLVVGDLRDLRHAPYLAITSR